MTGTKAKSTILNTGDGKTVSGAWPNHDSGRQDDRLGGVSHQYATSSENRRQEMALKGALGAVPLPKGVSNGECRFKL
ncbi:MAG: hypothetical protein K8H74_02530 [Notoacmeibacter sp.]|nr:hypothetical protein [Notoacmeibacter sp.]